MRLKSVAIVVVEDKPIGVDRGALDQFTRAAGEEEPDFVGRIDVRRNPKGAVVEIVERANARGVGLPILKPNRERGQELFPGARVGQRDAARIGADFHAVATQRPGGLADGNLRPAVGPTAAQRQIEAQSQLRGPLRREPQRIEKRSRHEGKVVYATLGIVEGHRVNRLHLEAADAALLHVLHFTG